MNARRPIDRSDAHRLYAVLAGLELAAAGDGRELWQILADVHRDLPPPPGVPGPDPELLVGDRAAVVEVQHARLVAEGLLLYGGTVPTVATRGVMTVCGTPGCPEPVWWGVCLSCELAAARAGPG